MKKTSLRRINIFSQNYPSEKNIYAAAFVHSRCKGYKEQGYNVHVYSLTDHSKAYVFDDIKIFQGDEERLNQIMQEHKVDSLCSHMPNMREMAFLDKYLPNIPLICWFHGNESVWSAFLYPYHGNMFLIPLKFIRRLWIDFKKKGILREFINRRKPEMVFVSQWMLKNTENLLGKLPREYCNLIPNPVDEKIFAFKQRSGKVNELVCVRPHTTRKYALDLVIKAFQNSKYKVYIFGASYSHHFISALF